MIPLIPRRAVRRRGGICHPSGCLSVSREIGLISRFPALCALLLGMLVPFPSAAVGAKEHVVRVISDYENLQMSFDPATLQIEPGDTVVWVNQDDEEHNMVTYPDGFPEGAKGFASPSLKKRDEMWSHTFAAEGTYEYHCVPHLFLGMRGSVTVTKPSRITEFHTPTREEIHRYRELVHEFHGDIDFTFVPRARRGYVRTNHHQ